MAMVVTILSPILLLFPCVHLLMPYKKRKELRERQVKRGKEEKNVVGVFRQEWFQDPCLVPILVNKELVVSLAIVPLGRLVVNITFRFWGHNEAYESNHFLEQKRKMMTKTTPTSTTNKGEEAKGGCVLCSFQFSFVVGPFFLCFCQAQKAF